MGHEHLNDGDTAISAISTEIAYPVWTDDKYHRRPE